LGSNGLGLLSIGCLDNGPKREILPTEFSPAHSTKNSMLHHIMHLDPLPDDPKSSIGCIKINCDGWEAMVWVFCQLVALVIPSIYKLYHVNIMRIWTRDIRQTFSYDKTFIILVLPCLHQSQSWKSSTSILKTSIFYLLYCSALLIHSSKYIFGLTSRFNTYAIFEMLQINYLQSVWHYNSICNITKTLYLVHASHSIENWNLSYFPVNAKLDSWIFCSMVIMKLSQFVVTSTTGKCRLVQRWWQHADDVTGIPSSPRIRTCF
jgi:hypothetical protein